MTTWPTLGRGAITVPPGKDELWIRLVGTFAAFRGDRMVTTVGSRKARALVAFLAVERGRLVPADRVVDALWGEHWPRRPLESVATLVSRLRSALGTAAVAGGRKGYRLGEMVQVDLWTGAELVKTAELRLAADQPNQARAAAEQAVELLGQAAVLANEPEAMWAEPARAVQTSMARRARHALADAALRTADLPAAEAAAETVIRTDPFDETAHRILMRAYHAAGEPARALAAYERLRATLADEFGIDPSTATRNLHSAILRSAVPTK